MSCRVVDGESSCYTTHSSPRSLSDRTVADMDSDLIGSQLYSMNTTMKPSRPTGPWKPMDMHPCASRTGIYIVSMARAYRPESLT